MRYRVDSELRMRSDPIDNDYFLETLKSIATNPYFGVCHDYYKILFKIEDNVRILITDMCIMKMRKSLTQLDLYHIFDNNQSDFPKYLPALQYNPPIPVVITPPTPAPSLFSPKMKKIKLAKFRIGDDDSDDEETKEN